MTFRIVAGKIDFDGIMKDSNAPTPFKEYHAWKGQYEILADVSVILNWMTEAPKKIGR
jgi:hypothetical protein